MLPFRTECEHPLHSSHNGWAIIGIYSKSGFRRIDDLPSGIEVPNQARPTHPHSFQVDQPESLPTTRKRQTAALDHQFFLLRLGNLPKESNRVRWHTFGGQLLEGWAEIPVSNDP